LIWFDNLNTVATPNYFVQKLFGTNKGSYTVSVLKDKEVIAGKDSVYASATIDEVSKELILKLVNISRKSVPLKFSFAGGSVKSQNANMEVLKNKDLTAWNSFSNPLNVGIELQKVKVSGRSLMLSLDGNSVNVLRIKL